MTRLLVCAMTGLLPAFAVAAPVPKATDAEKVGRLFGTPVDPGKDCRFALDGEKLTVRVPGEPHLLAPDRGLTNAPRVVRTVTGDFTARVKIRLVRPAESTTVPGAQPPSFLAGIAVWQDERNFVYHARQLRYQSDKLVLGGAHGLYVNGGQTTSGGSGGGAFDAETAVFRFTRTGQEITPAASSDGVSWHVMPKMKVEFPAEVTVGLFVAHDARVPFAAEFEEFTVTPLASGEKSGK